MTCKHRIISQCHMFESIGKGLGHEEIIPSKLNIAEMRVAAR